VLAFAAPLYSAAGDDHAHRVCKRAAPAAWHLLLCCRLCAGAADGRREAERRVNKSTLKKSGIAALFLFSAALRLKGRGAPCILRSFKTDKGKAPPRSGAFCLKNRIRLGTYRLAHSSLEIAKTFVISFTSSAYSSTCLHPQDIAVLYDGKLVCFI